MRKNITETPKKNRQSRSQLSGKLNRRNRPGGPKFRYCILNQGRGRPASAVATIRRI